MYDQSCVTLCGAAYSLHNAMNHFLHRSQALHGYPMTQVFNWGLMKKHFCKVQLQTSICPVEQHFAHCPEIFLVRNSCNTDIMNTNTHLGQALQNPLHDALTNQWCSECESNYISWIPRPKKFAATCVVDAMPELATPEVFLPRTAFNWYWQNPLQGLRDSRTSQSANRSVNEPTSSGFQT